MCIDHDPYQTQAPEGRKVYMGTCCQTPVTPLGFKRLLDTIFYIPVAPLVLRCDLPKPRGGERCIRRTKLTHKVRFPNRTVHYKEISKRCLRLYAIQSVLLPIGCNEFKSCCPTSFGAPPIFNTE